MLLRVGNVQGMCIHIAGAPLAGWDFACMCVYSVRSGKIAEPLQRPCIRGLCALVVAIVAGVVRSLSGMLLVVIADVGL